MTRHNKRREMEDDEWEGRNKKPSPKNQNKAAARRFQRALSRNDPAMLEDYEDAME